MIPNAGMQAAVDQGLTDSAGADDAEKQRAQQEENQVKAILDEYNQAREFDKRARAQYAIDRRYAAGTAHMDWAVSANLIGSFIDILVSFLYARNPDVSAFKPAQVDNRGTRQQDDFARTMQLVISALWRAPTSTLKVSAQKMVRSGLSTGIGWLKAILICQGTNIPQMQTKLNDSRENIANLQVQRDQLLQGDPLYGGEYKTVEELDAAMLQLQELEQSLQSRMEVALRKALVVDFVRAEDVQVSLDVSDMEGYKSAGWIANAIYRTEKDLLAQCPSLKAADLVSATTYYQRDQKDLQPLEDVEKLTGMPGVSPDMHAAEAEQFVSAASPLGATGVDQNMPKFYKIIERWNRVTGHIETIVEGVKKFARPAYEPDYPTSRFFPYFMLSFYPVDGARHPQSLPWRLFKLMDEYNAARSSKRLSRDRSVPATMFNASGLAPEEAEKIRGATNQELIPVSPTDSDAPLSDLFAAKPVSTYDPRMFDTAEVIRDMERISGVQEALQSAISVQKTATEAQIQQTGFASRTTADRDRLETVLSDLAHYTGELALGGLKYEDARRIAGDKAFWPHGMAVEDLLTMVEIEIQAGTTGKPKEAGDRDAWGVIMPQLQTVMEKMYLATMQGNLALAESYSELIRETMTRFGDDIDPERFIPEIPKPPMAGMPPALPGAPGAAPPADVPPDDAPISDLVAPNLAAPNIAAPAIPPPA